METLAKALIVWGLIITMVGAVLWLSSHLLGGRIPFGHLPGDIYIKRDNFVFYAPIVSFLLISIIATLVINIIARIFHR
ncbi:DUF2905 domain-containing protein [Coprothermobacteraceae bacterium]|nr:DUF2905 domain-containing protein [Coprothermobacteraceae bacterium]